MRIWFADSHYYLALLSETDECHARAAEMRARPHRVVTTVSVLTEVGDGLAAPRRRQAFVGLLRALRASRAVEIVPMTDELFNRGCELYAQRPDKNWSLTDCISFVVMRDHGLCEALTGDHHFEQAGFRALLKE